MAEGNGGEGALAAATGGVDKGVIALQIFSYVVVVLAIICLLAVAYKVILINFNQSVTVFNVFNSSVFFPNQIGSSIGPFFSHCETSGLGRNEALKNWRERLKCLI